MSNIYGRQVVLPLTNKSGGSVAAGDVVIVDTSNNDAFTTTTSASDLKALGVAQETIANNASGRICMGGYVSLVNVNASVTRGNFGATYTVAKQATDAGSTRAAGTFMRFLTGGTTPDAWLYPVDLAGAALTDPTSARGDIIVRGAAALARLALGATGKFLGSDGTDAAWSYPPGHQLDYVENTSSVSVTATAETSGGATVVVTGTSQSYAAGDVWVEFYTQQASPNPTAGAYLIIHLWDGTTEIGDIVVIQNATGATSVPIGGPVFTRTKVTLTAATHQFIVRAHTSGGQPANILSGAGGAATRMPTYLRVVTA